MPNLALKKHEIRSYPFEVKSIETKAEDGGPLKDANGIQVARIKGYASVFGKVDWYDDSIQKGAFTKTLRERPKVKVLWQHDPNCPIGKPNNMAEDNYGLLVEFDLNLETEKGREAYALLKQGAIDGLSIGFETINATNDAESGIRAITEVRLWEFSVVTFQAQEAAMTMDVRSLDDRGAITVMRFEKARLGIRDLSRELRLGFKTKDFTASAEILDALLDDLGALRKQIDAAAEPAEPALSHSEADEVELRGTIELLKALA